MVSSGSIWSTLPSDEGPVERSLAPTLQLVGLLICVAGLPSLPALVRGLAATSSVQIDVASNCLFGMLGLTALILVRRGRVRAGTWLVVGSFVIVWMVAMPTHGLVHQAGALSMLVFPTLLAGLALGRRGLWITFSLIVFAIALGAVADGRQWSQLLAAAPRGSVTFRGTTINLAIFCILVDWAGVRLRQALIAEADKSAALVAEQARRAELERSLAHAKRLEAMSRLAGSVAHDFNNLLTGMLGNTELAAELIERGDARDSLMLVLDLGERARSLTNNLLRFSKGQATESQTLDIHELLLGSERIYTSLVGRQIEFGFLLAATRTRVECNPGKFEQVLLNLVVNATDAMPQGGKLTIGTRDLARAEGQPARVEVFVSDTGMGMSESTRVRIFEPFFTTKCTGTGIGLATVLEIVREIQGQITVDSALGVGTTVRVVIDTVEAGP